MQSNINFLYKIFVFAIGLCCCSCILGKTAMTDQDILALLRLQVTDTDYFNIVSRNYNYDMEIIDRKENCAIYKFSSIDIGANEHDFIFCLNSNLDKVFLLTSSLNNYNQYILPEYKFITEEKARLIAEESSLFTREFYKRFVLLDSIDKAKEWLTETGVSALSERDYQLLCVADGRGYKCQVPVLIAQDLFLRKFTIESQKVSFNDQHVKSEVGEFYSLH
jgi:hypothetical protein